MKLLLLFFFNTCISIVIFSQDFINQKYDNQRILRPRGSLGCLNIDTSDKDYKYGTLFDFTSENMELFPFEEQFKSAYLHYNNSQICNKEGRNVVHFNGWDLTDRYGDTVQLKVFGSFAPYPFECKFATNGSVILPLPGRDNAYLLIGVNDHQYEVKYSVPAPEVLSVVYFSENDQGKVRIDSVVREFFRDKMPESSTLIACRHANGRDWWLLCTKRFSSIAHMFIIDPQGIRYHGSHDSGELFLDESSHSPLFSPDGTYYTRTAVENFSPPSPHKKKNRCQIYRFDRCEGILTPYLNFYLPQEDTSSIAQLMFDQNSRYIYAPTGKSIWQGDILAQDVPNSFEQVCVADLTKIEISGPHSIGTGFLGPDNKMYFFDDNNKYGVTVVNHPELPGLECQAKYSAVYKPSCTGMSVGNMPYFSMGPLDGSPCDTLGLDNPLSTDRELVKHQDFFIYPNPSGGLLYADIPEAAALQRLRVLDFHGRTLLSGKAISLKEGLDVSFLMPGVYYVIVEGYPVKKVVKI